MTRRKITDWQAAHKHFSSDCFNRTWVLIEKPALSSEDELEMVQLATTSLWHWMQRKDATPTNLTIGYWQASYAYSLIGQAELGMRYAALCKEVSEKLEPFFLGEAFQALASAAKASGDTERLEEYLTEARDILNKLSDPEEKAALERDIKGIDRVKVRL